MSKKNVKQEEPKDDTQTKTIKKENTEGKVYTYVGGGEDSPRVINFMGRQKFVRGQATEVTDPLVLDKLKNHPTFAEGEVDQEDLHEYDEKAKEEADAQREQDKITQAAAKKKNNKFKGYE